jgi:hypothetical protein
MANAHYADEFYDNAARAEVSRAIVNKKVNVCPFTVRLAWHASGTFDQSDASGGSDGARMRYAPELSDGANAGLALMQDIIKPVKEKFPDMSYADLWTMAGTQAIKLTGGPDIPFNYGRTDDADNNKCPANGRLPDATQGAEHLRDVFYRMGFGDKEIVALSGAHTLGSCHRLRSGFDGPWTTNPLKFDNEYFKNLLEIDWKPREWEGPLQYQDPSGKLMMLPTDMALIQDEAFLPFVKKYAEDEQAFFADFAEAFAALISKGCPAHCQPNAERQAPQHDSNKEFRDLAMHGSVERMEAASEGVDVNAKEAHSERTAMHKAAFFGHSNVMEYLIGLKGDVNAVDADGDTPLHDAAKFGHDAVVEALLKAGADKTIRNKEGKSATDLAAANGKDAVVKMLA